MAIITYGGMRNGFSVSIQIDAEKIDSAALDKIEARLLSLGIVALSAERDTRNGNSRRRKDTPVCPRHNKAMKLGPYGYYCQTRITDAEPQEWENANGYCNHKEQ